MDPSVLALLVLAATMAGFIDAIAGGGGLITLPALLLAGVPAPQAIATNKLQGTFGVAMASWRYWRAGAIDIASLLAAVLATALGAGLGAAAIAHSDASSLRAAMPYLLIGAALYFAFAPLLHRALPPVRISPLAFALGLAGTIGFYDGFFGPGAGSLYTLAFLLFAGAGLMTATAHAKVLNFTSNIVSLAVFLAAGQVSFAIGLPMAAGQALGAWIGSHVALKHGDWVIRPLLVVTTAAVALKLLSDR